MNKFAGCWFGETTSLSACRLFIRATRQDIRDGGAGWLHDQHFDMSRRCINDRCIPFRWGSCLLCTTPCQSDWISTWNGTLKWNWAIVTLFQTCVFPSSCVFTCFFPATLTSQQAGGLTFFHIKRHDLNFYPFRPSCKNFVEAYPSATKYSHLPFFCEAVPLSCIYPANANTKRRLN